MPDAGSALLKRFRCLPSRALGARDWAEADSCSIVLIQGDTRMPFSHGAMRERRLALPAPTPAAHC